MTEQTFSNDRRYEDLQTGQAYCVRVNKGDGEYKYVRVLSATVLEKSISEGWFGEDFYVGISSSLLNS